MNDLDLFVSLLKINEPVDSLENGQPVTFNEYTNTVGKRAIFLKDVQQTDILNEDIGTKNFTATYVNDAEAARIVNETGRVSFFYVHGWGVQISHVVDHGRTLKDKFRERELYYSIPVLHPITNIEVTPEAWEEYKNDQQDMVQAGDLFRNLNMDDFPPKKAIMMHSMGNHLIVSSFQQEFSTEFQNIFMVAADVPHDIFSGNPGNNDEYGGYETKTSNMVDALNDNGMIIITSHERDRALELTGTDINFNNGIERIGLNGPNCISREKVMFINVSERYEADNGRNHGYHLEQFMIDIYEEAVPTIHP
mmetsp:Transcript_2294/g.2623  ORF Transcript_2294/g.2623 Transcript_2294/m.2623 type:complete len:308 (+) Transcript_2294:83-1006(+)|eukprot:CAMPEP_0170781814 /NCGR_PEP_ID=MMETSP0733-20121128/14456_1 /TAXON_ID=186038 /ORGANISM="Fragilariopsis kerguelensis, Strain L26-C5" /LENGTH=307 /DNA_ID=CAMNT_0011125991 /DNA_START=64 /DNA_END=987 /DNA_ORIENTATION=-